MLLQDALTMVSRLIETEETHPDYTRTIELAEKYQAMITGNQVEKQLVQFVQREDAAQFAQRVAITRSITPAVAASVRRPFNKVARNDRIKKGIKLGLEKRQTVVEQMAKSFYGAKRKKNKGLDYWLKSRFTELQFSDPNAWVVIEWETPEDPATVVQPRPFEVSAVEARNFLVVNDDVRWLLVRQDIKYFEGTAAEKVKKDGVRWTLYDEDVTVVFEQVDKGYFLETQEGATADDLTEIRSIVYWVKSFEPKIGFAPVIRVGYNRDEETQGRTFVNPWHAGLCYFDKMLITVSEFDLTTALHTFPQKLQYVQKCPGESKERKCNKGWCNDGTRCTECRGTGYKIHTTAQEAILLPMPDSPDDMLPLENLLVYKTPPIELIRFQNEYCLQLERQVHQAVYNSQVFVKNNYSGEQNAGNSGPIEQTATAADYNMESVYDTLEPYTEKTSETWKDIVTIFSIIAGETDIEKIDLTHNFPEDLKLKNSGLLMAERKAAKESGAPPFLIETIDDDLANITFAGDLMAQTKYRVKRRYAPFPGKNEEEIAALVSSQYTLKKDKILYSNFDRIFKELENENPGFYLMTDLKAQAELVETKTEEISDELSDDEPKFNPGNFSDRNPAGGGATGEEDSENPGDDEGENNPAE